MSRCFCNYKSVKRILQIRPWLAGTEMQLDQFGRLRGSRNRLSEAVICALLRDFSKHGEKAIAKVRREQPGVYLRCLTLLVPREHKLEHSNAIKEMTDEQLEQTLAVLKELIAQRDAGASAKVIDGVPEPVPALPPPSRRARRKARRSDRADSGLAARVVGTDSADGNS